MTDYIAIATTLSSTARGIGHSANMIRASETPQASALDQCARNCDEAATAIRTLIAERDKSLSAIGEVLDHELRDVELEDALKAVGIYTYGPDAERFEQMFAAAMKCRAALKP